MHDAPEHSPVLSFRVRVRREKAMRRLGIMAKRIALLLGVAGIVGTTLPTTAAAGPPEGGCPFSAGKAAGWERVTVQSLVDAGVIIAGGPGIDLNGNGHTCVMFPPGQGAPAGIPTIRDDTVPPSAE
jgi:hypothetical protein